MRRVRGLISESRRYFRNLRRTPSATSTRPAITMARPTMPTSHCPPEWCMTEAVRSCCLLFWLPPPVPKMILKVRYAKKATNCPSEMRPLITSRPPIQSTSIDPRPRNSDRQGKKNPWIAMSC